MKFVLRLDFPVFVVLLFALLYSANNTRTVSVEMAPQPMTFSQDWADFPTYRRFWCVPEILELTEKTLIHRRIFNLSTSA